MKMAEKMAAQIGVDFRMGGHSGIGRYLTELYARLPRHLAGAEFTFFGHAPRPAPRNSRVVPVRSPIYGWREQLELPAAAGGNSLSLFHAPHWNAPLAVPAPLAVTVHDLIHLLFPEYLPRPRLLSLAYARLLVRAACSRARVVLTVSENTRRDLVRVLGVEPRKIVVTPLGVDPGFRPVRDAGAMRSFLRQRNLATGYILYVGNLKPHKNIERLVRAFSGLSLPGGMKLVLAGSEDRRYRGVRDEVKKLRLGGRVVFSGVSSTEELRLLYSGARVLVLPSLYEGFGLPPLEAMACGTPVVASRTSSIPEVVGDAGLLVPPRDEGALARAIRAAALQDGLRRRLRARGLKRARLFDWDETARLTASAFIRAIRG
jgi:glycosyltransferase involved in cell wall biosynthesis